MVKTEVDITIQEFASLQKNLTFPIRITSDSTIKDLKRLKNKGEIRFEEYIKTMPLIIDVESVQYIYNFLFNRTLFNLLEENRKRSRNVLE